MALISITKNWLFLKRVFVLLLGSVLLNTHAVLAQCAMCRVQLENNVSNGETSVAANLNFGILYLFAGPYLAVGIIAFFWYKNSKKK